MKNIATVNKKLEKLNSLKIALNTTKHRALFNTSYQVDFALVDELIALLNGINTNTLSSATNEKMGDFIDEINIFTRKEKYDKNLRKWVSFKEFTEKLHKKKTLAQKLSLIKNECICASDGIDIDYSDQAFEQAYQLIPELVNEYIERETTNILQYKLKL